MLKIVLVNSDDVLYVYIYEWPLCVVAGPPALRKQQPLVSHKKGHFPHYIPHNDAQHFAAQ